MRHHINICLAALCFMATTFAGASAAPELSPEEKAVAECIQGMSSPSKQARVSAIERLKESKPENPHSWRVFVQAMASDPEPEVRRAAFGALAQMSAHDTSVAKLLVNAYNELKANDLKQRNLYAKLMKTVEFKADLAGVLADNLSKLRWPEEPKGYGGRKVSQEVKEKVKEERDEIKHLLESFEEISKATGLTADKELPAKVKKWWAENEAKLQRADAEIMSKYAQADAEAAKAAKAKAEEEKKKAGEAKK